jgi:hypothetical protein
MATDLWRQVTLRVDDTEMVCWIPDDPLVSAGSVITLKEMPGIRWTVAHVYESTIDKHPRRTWRVGGLP